VEATEEEEVLVEEDDEWAVETEIAVEIEETEEIVGLISQLVD
jgi:hypothetical protein